MQEKILRLSIRGLDVGYEGRAVVQGIELDLAPGEILTLIGPNGAGKSTILKTISRQLEPLGGAVYLGGRELAQLSSQDCARQLSVLLTGHMRTDLLSCLDVVETGRYPYTGALGTLSDDDRAFVRATMEMVGVWELRERDFMRISDGQRQRVLLARAIAQDPSVIVLDEPSSYLDIRHQVELLHILRRLSRERQTSVVMSMHELNLARAIADSVLCVHASGRLFHAKASEVFTPAVIKELFDIGDEGYELLFGAGAHSPVLADSAAEAPAGRAASPEHEAGQDRYVSVGAKLMRCGLTTGTCAAAATRAAAELLLSRQTLPAVSVELPSGTHAVIAVEGHTLDGSSASCWVRKDAGDDPDVTDGALVCAQVSAARTPGISIDGGEGVGRVTLPGLDQPPGNAAINSVPRAMIAAQAQAALESCSNAPAGLSVVISIPDGEQRAAKTFNPRLGIEGGLSILGTTGIVRPMSEDALIATIRTELSQRKALGQRDLILTPGNYGAEYVAEVLGIELERAAQCSNYLGQAIDMAVQMGFSSLLLVGHIGKLSKAAGGLMNTHSRIGDGRREVIASHAALCGASSSTVRSIMGSATTDAMLELLAADGILEQTMASLMGALEEQLRRRAGTELKVGAIMFSKPRGLLGQTSSAQELLALHRTQAQKEDR